MKLTLREVGYFLILVAVAAGVWLVFTELRSESRSQASTAPVDFSAIITIYDEANGTTEEMVVTHQHPDSWTMRDPRQTFILIGDTAWRNRGAAWEEMEPDFAEFLRKHTFENFFDNGMKQRDARNLGSGPSTNSEPTTRLEWIVEIPDSYRALGVLPVQSQTMPELKGVSIRNEALVGTQSKRLYEKTIIVSSPAGVGTFSFSFDYDSPVDIQPPK